MELADLRAFVRIAEEGSISQAARVLKQPKSSVSRGLVRLERSVGAVLVDRSSQHLRLTDAGVLLRSRAMRLLDEADDVRAALDGLAEQPRGRLGISATYSFVVGLIAPMLPGFAKAYPDIHVASMSTTGSWICTPSISISPYAWARWPTRIWLPRS